jgi:hypothetical protein
MEEHKEKTNNIPSQDNTKSEEGWAKEIVFIRASRMVLSM